MRWCAALLLVGSLVVACANPEPETAGRDDAPESPPEPDRAELCRGIHNHYECSRVVERVRLSPLAGRIDRRGDTLLIELEGARRIPIVDRDLTPAESVHFTYRDYLEAIGYHLLEAHFYEGSANVLIEDRTGERTRIPAPPVVSPRGRRIVVASSAGIAGYPPNELQVWRVSPDGLELEWDLTPEDWGATGARWEGPGTVRFTRTRLCDGAEICRSPATVRLRDGEWTVVE